MSEQGMGPIRRRPYILRIIQARPRLAAAIVVGIVLTALLPSHWWMTRRLLVGWDAGVALYLVLVYGLMARSEVHHIRDRAAREDEGRFAILVLTVFAALASLGAILVELSSGQNVGRTPMQLILAATTIVLSWVFTHTIFALHYAHEFYGEGANNSGLDFPGESEPDYWDFVYFAFVIGTTSQVSDVAVASKLIRRTVSAHGITSFFFNAALLALTVNITASAI